MTSFIDCYIGYIFPFFFLAIWVLVLYLLSKFGYHSLVKKYIADKEFFGNYYGMIYAKINFVQYKNSLVLQSNEKGIYIKPIIFFKLFHPAIFIPFTEIKSINKSKLLFVEYIRMEIGKPYVADLTVKAKVFYSFEELYSKNKSNLT